MAETPTTVSRMGPLPARLGRRSRGEAAAAAEQAPNHPGRPALRSETLRFARKDLRRAIPSRCFVPSTRRSVAYLLVDLAALGALYVLEARIDPFWSQPVFWLAEGTLFWALFVIGHDCGHGSFSRGRRWNEWVGHLVHTPLLVPFHSWRLSHQIHHRYPGHVDRDETWFPLTERQVRETPAVVRLFRFRLFLLVFPLYLLRRTPARPAGSHFRPSGGLFRPSDRPLVRRSVALVALAAAGLAAWIARFGPGPFLDYYLAPYVVFVVWLDLVTYLHHTAPEVPWYRGVGWSPLRGALSTVDRRYGLFEPVHHHAGHHVVHHLFPGIPHYRLREATEAIRPVLGAHYRASSEPIHRALWRAARTCHVVPQAGEVVRYRALSGVPTQPEEAERVSPVPNGAGSSPATT